MVNRDIIESPILLTGIGRSGTTILADILSSQEGFLRVEEPNFITDLIVPYLHGNVDETSLLEGLKYEGWRGSMKICRTLSEDYPEAFANHGKMPIRFYMQNCFEEIVSLKRNSDNHFECVKNIIFRIITDTWLAANRSRWLLKQPSAISSWRDLLSFWPDMNIIFVGRNLYYIMLSRLKRGYQKCFNEALDVCRKRLYALLDACKEIHSHILLLNIADVCQMRDDAYNQICNICNRPFDSKVREKFDLLDANKLIAIGDPRLFFSKKQKCEIESLRLEINKALEYELV